MTVPLKLYGGAITGLVPEVIAYDLTDAANFRQIPDTQEVFIVPTASKSAKFDKSLIFDLLEYVPHDNYAEAIATHIEELVDDDTDVSNHFIEQIKDTANEQVYISLIEYQNKRRDAGEPDSPVHYITFIALIRLKKVDTDVLLTLNIPLSATFDLAELIQCLKLNQPPVNESLVTLKYNYDWFKELSHTFQVLDWSLFG